MLTTFQMRTEKVKFMNHKSATNCRKSLHRRKIFTKQNVATSLLRATPHHYLVAGFNYDVFRLGLYTMMALDTDEAAYRAQIAALRRLGSDGRAKLAAELSDEVRALTELGIRRRKPDFTDAQVRHELLRIFYGADIADRASAHFAQTL